MILFFCYSSRDLNRLIGDVLVRERDNGGGAAVVGVGRAEADELRSLGLDPIRLALDEPVPADVEALAREWLGQGGDRGPFFGVPPAIIAALSRRVGVVMPPATGSAEVLTRTLRLVARTACLVDALAPRLMVIWNGTVGVPAVAVAVARARGVPLLFIERGPLPGLVQLDPLGFNGESSIASQRPSPRVDDAAVAWADGVVREVGRRAPADPRVAELLLEKGSSPRDRVALFADQLWSDHRHVTWTEDVYGALVEAYRGSAFRLVVKRHPLDHEGRGRAIEGLLPGSVFAEEGDIRTWLERADHVVTVDSSVGLQAALLGRPVILLAAASYGGPGTVTKHITRDAASVEDLAAVVTALAREPATPAAEVAAAASHFLAWWRTRDGVFGTQVEGEGARLHAIVRRYAEQRAASPSALGASRLLQGYERRVAALEPEVDRLRRRNEVLSAVEGHLAAPSIRMLGRLLRVVGRTRGLRSLTAVLALIESERSLTRGSR